MDIKEYKKQYYKENKEYYKERYEKNKEQLIEYSKQYSQENKEKIKEYSQTPQRIKTVRTANWKFRGLQCDYIDDLYEHYLLSDQCENCMCILTEGSKKTSTTKCMDHCHITGLFRNILCNSCNVKRK